VTSIGDAYSSKHQTPFHYPLLKTHTPPCSMFYPIPLPITKKTHTTLFHVFINKFPIFAFYFAGTNYATFISETLLPHIKTSNIFPTKSIHNPHRNYYTMFLTPQCSSYHIRNWPITNFNKQTMVAKHKIIK
jgi:hypothetical protein